MTAYASIITARTAIPVGAERLYGIETKKPIPAGSLRSPNLTRRCSRRITLAFLPSAFKVPSISNVPIRAGKRARG
jgi:hypothetical protein